jgi:hypothetical protein
VPFSTLRVKHFVPFSTLRVKYFVPFSTLRVNKPGLAPGLLASVPSASFPDPSHPLDVGSSVGVTSFDRVLFVAMK